MKAPQRWRENVKGMRRFSWFYIGLTAGVLVLVLIYQAFHAGAPLPLLLVFSVSIFTVLGLMAKKDDRADGDS